MLFTASAVSTAFMFVVFDLLSLFCFVCLSSFFIWLYIVWLCVTLTWASTLTKKQQQQKTTSEASYAILTTVAVRHVEICQDADVTAGSQL